MPFILLLILFISIIPNETSAQTSIRTCFSDEKTDIGISFCLKTISEELETIRNIMEKETLEMMQDNAYIPTPAFDTEETQATELSTVKTRGGKKTSSQIKLERALKRIQERKNQKIAEQNRKSQLAYESKKIRLIKMLGESKSLFDKYRELECSRRKESVDNKGNSFNATFTYRVCMYELTNERIKHLQASIK